MEEAYEITYDWTSHNKVNRNSSGWEKILRKYAEEDLFIGVDKADFIVAFSSGNIGTYTELGFSIGKSIDRILKGYRPIPIIYLEENKDLSPFFSFVYWYRKIEGEIQPEIINKVLSRIDTSINKERVKKFYEKFLKDTKIAELVFIPHNKENVALDFGLYLYYAYTYNKPKVIVVRNYSSTDVPFFYLDKVKLKYRKF